MAKLPTGVTIVTAAGPAGPAGATANAVCSLSVEPMLMLACLDRGSRTPLAVQAADRFGISVLHKDQEQVARSFATKRPVAEKWAGVAWSERAGVPAIDGALVQVTLSGSDLARARGRAQGPLSGRSGLQPRWQTASTLLPSAGGSRSGARAAS